MIIFVMLAMAVWAAVKAVLRGVWFLLRPLTWPVRALMKSNSSRLGRKSGKEAAANEPFFRPPPE